MQGFRAFLRRAWLCQTCVAFGATAVALAVILAIKLAGVRL